MVILSVSYPELALFSYAIDYDGSLFQVSAGSGVNDRYQSATSVHTALRLNDLLAPYTGGQSGGEFTNGGSKGNSTPGNMKNWVCPFITAPAITTRNANGTYLNQGSFQLIPVWMYFNYSTTSHDEPVRGFGFPYPGFPFKISQARSDLPMAQDVYTRTGVNGLYAADTTNWYINHSSDANPLPTNNWYNPSYCPNFVPERLGFGATILFYDGSARHVPRQELVRVDINPTAQNWSVATKSVLSN